MVSRDYIGGWEYMSGYVDDFEVWGEEPTSVELSALSGARSIPALRADVMLLGLGLALFVGGGLFRVLRRA